MAKEPIKYPRFIPDLPLGEDVFKGQSQTRLAKCICESIKTNDAKSASNEFKLPRIIGLEGTWGSGKSNVIRKIEKSLASEGYYTFTYDAWGHQEDLQRRSILETLTQQLIADKVLKGSSTIKLRNGAEHTEPWDKQLSLLLSNKTTVKRRSIPKLSGAGIWAAIIVLVFALCSLIGDQLISNSVDFGKYCWIDLTPFILGFLVVLGYYIKDCNFENVKRLVDSNSEERVDEEYTSSEEPSVAEFKNWLKAISEHLGKAKKGEKNKLIIVFDNMDRLPSEKVMQLWSSIYTFFAGSEFENIWTIIPYDYKHLCEAIFEGDNDKMDSDRIKRFINKTFPIVYNVPEPVITDYRDFFNKFYEKAFGDTEENDKEHICQVFMRYETRPNPRTVISFINELVAMRLQWSEAKYRLKNIALFVLKKDMILYNKKESMDRVLVSDALLDDIINFYPEKEVVRKQLCQFAYGLEDENLAGELPLKNLLEVAVKQGSSIAEYAKNPNFVEVLITVLSTTEIQTNVDNSVQSLATLDSVATMTEEDKNQIAKKWDSLANFKANINFNEHKCDDTIKTLIPHISDKCLVRFIRVFCEGMQKCEMTDGASYYVALLHLDECLEKAGKDIDITQYLRFITVSPERYEEYVIKAQEDYKRYKLKVDNRRINEYLFDKVKDKNDNAVDVLNFIKEDDNYDFALLRTWLSNLINQWDKSDLDIRIAAYVNRILDEGSAIVKTRFTSEIVYNIMQSLQTAKLEEMQSQGNEDIFAMYLADGKDVNNFKPEMVKAVSGCFNKYVPYIDVLKKLGDINSSMRRLVNIYCIKNCVGTLSNMQYVAQNFLNIRTTLEVTTEEMFYCFNRCSEIEWQEKEIEDYITYIHSELFEDYKNNPGNFSNSIIELGINAMSQQPEAFLVNSGNTGFWRNFVLTYLGSEFLKTTDEKLTVELISMLDAITTPNANKDTQLLESLLSHCPDEGKLNTFLNEKMNSYFYQHNVSIQTFLVFGKLLPRLGSDMHDNVARGLVTHFIKPIYNNTDCAQIITDQHTFYFSILNQARDVAQEVLKGMLSNKETELFYLPLEAEIKEMIDIKEEQESDTN